MAVQEVVAASSTIKWGDISVVGLMLAAIVYLYRQNVALKEKNESEMVARMEKAINNLSQTIRDSTDRFDNTIESMWTHIGKQDENIAAQDKKLSNLIGQHNVNHNMKVDG